MSGIAVAAPLKERLAELREEQREIENLLARYEGEQPKVRKTKAAAPKPKAKAKATTKKRGRGRPPVRANEFISLVEKNPGITVSEAAKQMKIKPNYLYRLSADLVKQGRVNKQGRGFKAAA